MANRKWGDRRDGTWIKDIDGMHAIMPYVYPNRADNEAFILEEIEMKPLVDFCEKKNQEMKEKVEKGELPSEALEDPYKPFQLILSALVKTLTLRPKMNRFIQGRRYYQRNVLSVGFVVKKKFTDSGAEALAYKLFDETMNVDDVHNLIVKEINFCKDENTVDNSIDAMNMFAKIPRFILGPVMAIVRRLDFYGRVPYSLVKTDPNYASVFLTNLGSIRLKSAYHHLSNWGTTSMFVVLGEKKWKPFYDREGNMEMKEVMGIGITVDERIADGYYYSKTIRLFKKLLANPELLETPANEPVEY